MFNQKRAPACAELRIESVMLVPAGSQDVVPRGRLVTLITLVDPRVWLTGDAGRDHLEVHHVVAGRSLMALRAIH